MIKGLDTGVVGAGTQMASGSDYAHAELEELKQVARVKYRKKQPAACEFCGTMIRCDMYRHVACCHLELAQLWRCPVSWCTVWKGAPWDFMGSGPEQGEKKQRQLLVTV